MSARTTDAPPAQWIHLFTSTIREQYIADAVDLVAVPERAHFRFRYERKYVDAGIRERWANAGLHGMPVAVHISLQHPADFHPAAFVPLRKGEVVRTVVEGDTFVVYFRLCTYLPLDDSAADAPRERAEPVHEYTRALKDLLGEDRCPDHGIHATLGPSPEALVTASGDQGRDFATTVRFLTAMLFFTPRTYWRIASITRSASGALVSLDDEGNLPLTAGIDYMVNLAHYQYQAHEIVATDLSVSIPSCINLVSAKQLTLRSRYDVIPIRLFPPFRDDVVTGELAIATEAPARGPTLRLPVLVGPSMTRSMFGPAIGVGGACAVALPPVLASDHNIGWRVALALVGAGLVGLGLWWRRINGLSG